jgi:hypothetical protein
MTEGLEITLRYKDDLEEDNCLQYRHQLSLTILNSANEELLELIVANKATNAWRAIRKKLNEPQGCTDDN